MSLMVSLFKIFGTDGEEGGLMLLLSFLEVAISSVGWYHTENRLLLDGDDEGVDLKLLRDNEYQTLQI